MPHYTDESLTAPTHAVIEATQKKLREASLALVDEFNRAFPEGSELRFLPGVGGPAIKGTLAQPAFLSAKGPTATVRIDVMDGVRSYENVPIWRILDKPEILSSKRDSDVPPNYKLIPIANELPALFLEETLPQRKDVAVKVTLDTDSPLEPTWKVYEYETGKELGFFGQFESFVEGIQNNDWNVRKGVTEVLV